MINPFFDWDGDRPPRTPYNETVIYEAHVKGLTEPHPDIPEELRGTYAGLAHPAMIEHLTRLGVTAIELMPVHQFVTRPRCSRSKGLRNYWGYNTIGFFAPHDAYSADRPTAASRCRSSRRWCGRCTRPASRSSSTSSTTTPPRATTSGPRCPSAVSTTRPTTGWSRTTRSTTWTTPAPATSLNVRHPHSLQLIMDSLRYWVTEMHVDGFRFDLAADPGPASSTTSTGCRAFFDLVQQDPVVSQVKLIAEPWDVGPGGYQVGNFPPLWTEWNGKYRDTVRDFWRGEPATLGEFASRLTGSSDLYEHDGRRPVASINFVTAHDGFTLRRPGLLQREAQRGQRRGQQRRREPQPLVELRRRGPDRRPGDHRAARAAAAQLPRDAAAVARACR